MDIYGYPANYMSNFTLLNDGGMKLYQYGFSLRGRLRTVDHSKFAIKYEINTLGGQSGCPIILNGNIIGVHNGSVGK